MIGTVRKSRSNQLATYDFLIIIWVTLPPVQNFSGSFKLVLFSEFEGDTHIWEFIFYMVT